MAACGLLGVAACSGDDGSSVDVVANGQRCSDAVTQAAPVVDLIDDALAAVDDHYGRQVDLFEVSADLQRVSVVAAVDGIAEQAFYCGSAGFSAPESLGEAEGPTFGSSQVELEPDGLFDELRDELGDPAIRDLAIRMDPELGVISDATIVSSAGGVLLVLLSPDGRILGVQGE